MQRGGFGLTLGLALAAALLTPATSRAQTVFTYSATDHHTVVMSESGVATISVSTIVIIQGSTEFQQPQVATRTFEVTFRPPDAEQPRLLQGFVDNRIVDINVVRSNIDGEMEATVEIPLTAGNSPDLKIDWSTKSAGTLEMSLKPTPQVLHPNLHTQKAPVRRALSGGDKTPISTLSSLIPLPAIDNYV